jgi:hypothetical protein
VIRRVFCLPVLPAGRLPVCDPPGCPGSTRVARVPCENFLYRFKAAQRGRSRRRLGRHSRAPADAPARLASDAGRLARRQRPGRRNPGSRGAAADLTRGPSRRLHRAYAVDLGRSGRRCPARDSAAGSCAECVPKSAKGATTEQIRAGSRAVCGTATSRFALTRKRTCRTAECVHIEDQGGPAAFRHWPGVSGGLSLGRPAHRTPGCTGRIYRSPGLFVRLSGTARSRLPRPGA